MAEIIRKIFFVTVVCLELTECSRFSTWKSSMAICDIHEQRPSTERDDLQNDTWVGKAKFVLSGGIITLEVQEVEEYVISLICNGSLGKRHEFCKRPIQLKDIISILEEIIQYLTPGQKYVIGNFHNTQMEEIPQPTQCMVHRGGKHTEYVACNNSFKYGCRDLEKPSNLKTIISLTPTSGSGSTISNYVEHCNRSVESIGNGKLKSFLS
ncbi:uncharacterized protein LOC134282754 [Saccostrea cucullata]|uniref:uncharacterized protein LOC134282754 n=1 Tax=Saccostrea cuccullata TaxID=36930 RepID=UPI002ED60491